MNFIWGLLTGIVVSTVVCLIWLKKNRLDSGTSNGVKGGKIVYMTEDEAKKAANLKKIEAFIADKDRFTNDDLQNMLGVSNATIGRYLQELETAGKIKQIGETGKFVYYTKN